MIKTKKYTHEVPDDFVEPLRLRDYIKGLFPYLETGSAVKKALKKDQIEINGELGKSGDWVSVGDEICFYYSHIKSDTAFDEVKIEIIYQDRDLMIVRKPAGISSSGNTRCLQSQLQSIEIEEYDGSLGFPYLVHRLDRATEGLIIAAKNIQTRRLLAGMLEKQEIRKRYILICEGRLSKELKWIDEPVEDKPANTEILDVEYLDTKDPASRVIVQLHTGRTHQIRRHFQYLGHPIVGDQLYNKDGLTFGTGLLLCAYYLKFKHPITNESVEVEYPIPSKVKKYGIIER